MYLNNINISNGQAAINGYKTQAEFFKKEAERYKCLYENSLNKNESFCNSSAREKSLLTQYDEIYNLNWTAENRHQVIYSNNENIVTLRRGVICNSLAYKNAYRCDRPGDFIRIISIGIYGKQDYSNRCVRKQKDTADKEILCPNRTEIIEEEFYNFLKLKRFSVERIEKEMNKLNRHHHNAIGITRRQLLQEQKNQHQVDEAIRSLQEQHEKFPLNEASSLNNQQDPCNQLTVQNGNSNNTNNNEDATAKTTKNNLVPIDNTNENL